MTPQEIKSALTHNVGTFPSDAMREAIAQREAITPIFLAELERMADDPKALIDEPGSYMLHIFAMFLLAQFREPRALAPLVKTCHLPIADLECLLGDIITENMGSILASVCGDDITPIKSIVENEGLDEFVRGAALSALVTLFAEDALARETLIEYLRDISRKFPPESPLWTSWVMTADDICAEELLPEIRAAYDANLVDAGWIRLSDIESTIREGPEAALTRLRQLHQYMRDPIYTLERWACFRDDEEDDPDTSDEDSYMWLPPPPQMPYFRETPKTGRNDPCPCGSGKKYKKCCMPV
jgi:uncharacterized protein YchJ